MGYEIIAVNVSIFQIFMVSSREHEYSREGVLGSRMSDVMALP